MNKKRYFVEQLLKTTKEWEAYLTAVNATLQVLHLRYNIPPEEIKDIRETLGFQYYIDHIIDTYMKYLSEDDLKQILDFYQSPIGKKMANEQLLFELARFNKSWAEEVNTLCKNHNKPASPPQSESLN
tara:strand:+ start:59 stop:442 length:384 start_codon:yes stop_codon:yes gene_type:complete